MCPLIVNTVTYWFISGDGNGGWQQYEDDDENEDDDEGQVIVAKPLNDVSSANFANYASLHENQLRHNQQHPAAQQFAQGMKQAGTF